MHWIFGLIRFYIFIKCIFCIDLYIGFKMHWVRISSANEKHYPKKQCQNNIKSKSYLTDSLVTLFISRKVTFKNHFEPFWHYFDVIITWASLCSGWNNYLLLLSRLPVFSFVCGVYTKQRLLRTRDPSAQVRPSSKNLIIRQTWRTIFDFAL